jgi:hypothetical protein
MQEPNGPDAWESLSELARSTEPQFEQDLAYCLAHPPDPVKHPATSAVISEYVKRLTLYLVHSKAGAAGLREQAKHHPNLLPELQEIERWIKQRVPGSARRPLPESDQDMLGNWLIKHVDSSYSKARQFVAAVTASLSTKGAPSKKPQTLRMLDARIYRGLSYPKLAAEMCDCDKQKHDQHCADTIRKRIKELEGFLKTLGITLQPPGEK